MTQDKAELNIQAPTGSTAKVVEPSLWNALPHFIPLTVFPLMFMAASYGGWWLAGPVAFFMLADRFDQAFGVEERNMDPDATREGQLFPYKLSLWLWAACWPVTFVFSLWQMFVVGHLSVWEIGLMAGLLTGVGQSVFIVGHELVHRRASWERRFGEFLLASASYPQYSTEHVYLHHPLVCTPGDPGSAPKGVSFWSYLPPEVANNLLGAWRFERDRLARRHLRAWHYTNAFWRYLVLLTFWYSLVYWIGGPWVALTYAALCGSAVFSMKLSNYVQHYGLRRIRLPGGRYEPVKARHAWSAAYKFTNWLYYNMQRHADHHAASNRRYPLLQHHGADASPQLPGSYIQMNGMAMFPKRWFATMDPLLDRQRAQFYPEIDDWSAYDSRAFAERPEAYEEIAEIHGAAPRIAKWINRSPKLLDSLRDREFIELDLPDGFGPDPEFEMIARRGLARVYWTLECGVTEMKEQLADIPAQDSREAVEVALEWSNRKVFQIAVHTMRGSLSPSEAATALSNVAEASIATVLSAVEEDLADRGGPPAGGGVAVAVVGALASREAAPGAELGVLFVSYGAPVDYYEALCRKFGEAIRALSQGNLLLDPLPRDWNVGAVLSLQEFVEHHRTAGSPDELLALTRARCVFVSGDSGIGTRFESARREVLAQGAARELLIASSSVPDESAAEPGLRSIEEMRGGFRDIERAALLLRLRHPIDASDMLAPDAVSVFRAAGKRGLIAADVADRLVGAATMWRNLRGSLRLVAEDGGGVETAGPRVKALVARACGLDDFDELDAAIRGTASRTAAAIDALAA